MSTESLQRDIEMLKNGELPPLNHFESRTTTVKDGLIISTIQASCDCRKITPITDGGERSLGVVDVE